MCTKIREVQYCFIWFTTLIGVALCYFLATAYSHLKGPTIITQKGHLKLPKAATEI